jgi:hypothetical protein
MVKGKKVNPCLPQGLTPSTSLRASSERAFDPAWVKLKGQEIDNGVIIEI